MKATQDTSSMIDKIDERELSQQLVNSLNKWRQQEFIILEPFAYFDFDNSFDSQFINFYKELEPTSKKNWNKAINLVFEQNQFRNNESYYWALGELFWLARQLDISEAIKTIDKYIDYLRLQSSEDAKYLCDRFVSTLSRWPIEDVENILWKLLDTEYFEKSHSQAETVFYRLIKSNRPDSLSRLTRGLATSFNIISENKPEIYKKLANKTFDFIGRDKLEEQLFCRTLRDYNSIKGEIVAITSKSSHCEIVYRSNYRIEVQIENFELQENSNYRDLYFCFVDCLSKYYESAKVKLLNPKIADNSTINDSKSTDSSGTQHSVNNANIRAEFRNATITSISNSANDGAPNTPNDETSSTPQALNFS
jgi:hypothetical protein